MWFECLGGLRHGLYRRPRECNSSTRSPLRVLTGARPCSQAVLLTLLSFLPVTRPNITAAKARSLAGRPEGRALFIHLCRASGIEVAHSPATYCERNLHETRLDLDPTWITFPFSWSFCTWRGASSVPHVLEEEYICGASRPLAFDRHLLPAIIWLLLSRH